MSPKYRRFLRILTVAVCLTLVAHAAVGLAKLRRWSEPLTPAQQLQANIDDVRGANGSGKEGGVLRVVPGEYDFGNQSLRAYSRMTLLFDHIRNTRIKSTAQFAILISGESGNSYVWRTTISGCTVIAAHGGIAFADADAEAAWINLEDMEVYGGAGAAAIDLRHPRGQYNYNVMLRNVTAQSDPGQPALILPAIQGNITDCRFTSYNYAAGLGGKPQGGVVLGADSICVTNMTVEGKWAGPGVYGYGQIDFRGLHCESTGGIVFDHGEITADTTSKWFAQPKQPVIMQSGTTLSVAGVIGWTDNGGGKNARIQDCFKTDATSALKQGSSVVLGKAVATGPVN
jgi:hypothetical protein